MIGKLLLLPATIIASALKRTASFMWRFKLFQIWFVLAGVEIVVNFYTPYNGTAVAVGVLILVGFLWLCWRAWAHWSRESPLSGKEIFEVGLWDSIKSIWYRRRGGIPMDELYKYAANSPLPKLRTDVGIIILGMTGFGKSTFAKFLMLDWELDGGVLAHTISSKNKSNEWVRFFRAIGVTLAKISSRDSDVRWDPFLDFDDSASDMMSIADGLFRASDVKDTGYSKQAKPFLAGCLAICRERYGDFSHLDDVMFIAKDEDPAKLIDEIWELDGYRNIKSLMGTIDDDVARAVYGDVGPRLMGIFESDICDSSLPRISLREEFDNPSRVLVLDNINGDSYANPFWRFLCQSAITISFQSHNTQEFLMDEIDKLPSIDNLSKLASAGRSDGTIGMIIAQDIHQLNVEYGEDEAESIWSNSPNRVCFCPGDSDTMNLVQDSIGKVDMQTRSVTKAKTGIGPNGTGRSVEYGTNKDYPVTTGEMQKMEMGDIVAKTPHGWWHGKVEEADVPEAPPESVGSNSSESVGSEGVFHYTDAIRPADDSVYGPMFPETRGGES